MKLANIFSNDLPYTLDVSWCSGCLGLPQPFQYQKVSSLKVPLRWSPQMAASVLRSLLLFCFCLFVQFSAAPLVTFTRAELLNVQQFNCQTFSLFFTQLESFAELSARGTAALYEIFRSHKRAKWTGVLIKLRQRGLWTALPSVHLVNVRSLANKIDEFSTEQTQTSADLPPCASPKPGLVSTSQVVYSIYQASNSSSAKPELSEKTRGDGIHFSINKVWCTYATVLKKLCSPQLDI